MNNHFYNPYINMNLQVIFFEPKWLYLLMIERTILRISGKV